MHAIQRANPGISNAEALDTMAAMQQQLSEDRERVARAESEAALRRLCMETASTDAEQAAEPDLEDEDPELNRTISRDGTLSSRDCAKIHTSYNHSR